MKKEKNLNSSRTEPNEPFGEQNALSPVKEDKQVCFETLPECQLLKIATVEMEDGSLKHGLSWMGHAITKLFDSREELDAWQREFNLAIIERCIVTSNYILNNNQKDK